VVLGLIDNLGFGEFTIVAIVALIVFGKRLPQVAGQAGAQLARLRRSLDSAWRETGVAKEFHSVKREIENAVPRDLSIGEMARMASADIQKNLRDVESQQPTVPRSLPASAAAKTIDVKMVDAGKPVDGASPPAAPRVASVESTAPRAPDDSPPSG
jgi:Sec-independent protein translocase protein TatA